MIITERKVQTSYTGTDQNITVYGFVDVVTDLPAYNYFNGFRIFPPSKMTVIDTSTDYRIDEAGNWYPVNDSGNVSVTLDLTGYYTSTETDTEISDAITDFQNNIADHRYLRIGTGTAVSNGTDLNTLKILGKYRNSNANNGCRNMPLEVSGRPFTLTVENMYGASRYKQTLWLGQALVVDRWYYRIMTNDTDWSDWYKVEGTAVQTDVPTP